MKFLGILLFVLIACNHGKHQNFDVRPLHPGFREFRSGAAKNRIDYFYIKGNFSYQKLNYMRLRDKINTRINSSILTDHDLYSVYVYRDSILKQKNKDGSIYTFDGQNKKLVAYIRYKQTKMDIFYIIKNGNVVYDLPAGKEVDFDFDE